MPIKLNLLPVEKRVGKGLQRTLRVTRMLGVISLGIFIVFGLGMAAFFVFSSVQLNNLNSSNTVLEGKISALETSETKMVLLKDRIGKIKSLVGSPTALNNLVSISSIITPVSAQTNINELNVNVTKISLSLNFKSAADISTFLKALSASQRFQAISVTSFSFNPVSGYLVSIVLTSK